MKLLTIVGARPQFIKAATISRVIQNRNGIEEILVHTGQHHDSNMSDIFFEEMSIPKPKYHLGIAGLGHGAMTGRMLEKIEEVILTERPDMVLVYGDTNSTLAGALAAVKIHIPVVHVEAGLRSFNMKMPEEVNRIITDRVSTILCCPTKTAVDNLEKEGFGTMPIQIFLSGDVMLDAVQFYTSKANAKSRVLQSLSLTPNEYNLVTIHRAENTDNLDRLTCIISALNEISEKDRIICPIHPRTRKILKERNIKIEFTLIDPVGYFDMLKLTSEANIVFTDSGGLQKEAFFFQKPCITLREETEWTELVGAGWNELVGFQKESILSGYKKFQKDRPLDYPSLYGDGKASEKIVNFINK
jgi:UDP-GlcNAc3NAcA epimerase